MAEKPAQCYAYRPITDAPETWMLDMCNADGRLTAESVAKAVSKFASPKTSGPEGQIINEDVESVRDVLLKAWKRVAPDQGIPATLKAAEDASEDGVSDEEYDSMRAFLTRLREELRGRVDADAWRAAVASARGYSGGKAPRRKVSASEELDEDEVDALVALFLEENGEADGDDVVELREWLLGSEQEWAEVDGEYLPLSATAHRFAVGNVQTLISTFGRWAGGHHSTCVSKLRGKAGIEDPDRLCAWLVDRYKGTTKWRGKKRKGDEPDWSFLFEGLPIPDDNRTAAEISHQEISSKLQAAINPNRGVGLEPVHLPYFWVRDIYDDYFVYSQDQGGDTITMFRRTYAVGDDGELTLGEPEPVELRTSYVPIAASERGTNELLPGFGLNVSLQSFADPPGWIPYLPVPGEYAHPRYGKIEVDKKRNQRFVDNFVKAVWQRELPIDLEHNYKLSGAAGWVKELRLNDDGSVDARVEWTDIGTEAIKRDRFKYFSPEWHEKWAHPITQEVYADVAIGGALCTKPFFKHDALRPLVASERALYTYDDGNLPESRTAFVRLVGAAAGRKQEDVVTDDKKTVALTEEEYDELIGMKGSLRSLTEELEAKTTQLSEAENRIGAMEADRRRQTFTELVTGRGGATDGTRWVGDVAKHVSFLEKLAAQFGEESEEFQFYVSNQQATAKQTRESSVFSVVGSDGGVDEPQSPWEKANRMAAEMVEADKTGTLTHDAALEKVFELNPRMATEN